MEEESIPSTEAAAREGEIAIYRLGMLEHIARIERRENCSTNQACRIAGVSAAQISRWRRAHSQGGADALRPQWRGRCGRPPVAAMDQQEIATAQRLLLQTGSQVTALRMLATLPECREEVAEAILRPRVSKHSIPRSLRDQIRVSQDVEAYHRGPRQARFEFLNPRSLTYLDALGEERQLQPGDLFERDDMSNNFLCHVPWPWGGDPCSDRYGVRVARGQLLVLIDVASLRLLSFTLLIRLRDSYRADDIWQWVGRTYHDIGVPRIGERWERGTWQARRLRGDDADIAEGHTPDEARRGGLAALGVRLIVSQSPTTKIIENRFNFLQRVMGPIPGQIGRNRGEMERENREWTASRNGHHDPRERWLSVEDVTARIEQAFAYCNAEPVEGHIYRGVPDARWQESVTENPLRTIDTAREGHLFARDRRTLTISRGHVMVRYTSPEGDRSAWWYYHPDLRLHEGRKVDVYLDEYTPGEGATLVLAEGRGSGTVIGHAQLVQGCPQFALAPGLSVEASDPDGIARRKRALNAVREEYRATGAADARWARGSRIDDGHGREVVAATGARHATRAQASVESDPSDESDSVTRAARPARQPRQAATRASDHETALADLAARERAALAELGL